MTIRQFYGRMKEKGKAANRYMTIGERIKALRREQGLSQAELASQLFITRQSVSLWEKGESTPSLENLCLLKKLYHISIDEWLDKDDEHDDNHDTEMPKPTGDACTKGQRTATAKSAKKIHLLVTVVCCVAILSIVAVGITNLVARYKTLYPFGNTDAQPTKVAPIRLSTPSDGDEKSVLWEQPTLCIQAGLPARFSKHDTMDGVFYDSNDNFVLLGQLTEEENLLAGTRADAYLAKKGHTSFINRSVYALSTDISGTTIFSSREAVEMSGAVRWLRSYLGVTDHAFCYITNRGTTVGFAVELDFDTWSIYWDVGDGTVWNIFIRDAELAGNQEALAAFLSTFRFTGSSENFRPIA